jgi:alkylhydroperoxidase family enzyme
MNFNVITPRQAPAASRPILDGIATELGLVPNLAAVAAASPVLLTAFDALRRAVADPSLSPVHREVAGVAVGVAVDNAYGVAFHSTVLASLGLPENEIDAMRAGHEPSSADLAAVYSFARQVVLRRGKVGDDVVDRARRVGFSDADLLAVVAECTFAGLVGTIDNLAGRVPLDDFLLPRQWKSEAEDDGVSG